jgi:WD40 repeat protein
MNVSRAVASRLGLGAFAALALATAAALAPRAGLANSTITDIPRECRMDSFRVGADGKGAPEKIFSTNMLGQWGPHAFHASHDRKTTIFYRFDGITVVSGSESRDYKVNIVYKQVWWSPDNKRILFWVPEGVALADLDSLGKPGGPLTYKVVYKKKPDRKPFGAQWSPTGNSFYIAEHYQEAVKNVMVQGGAVQVVSLDGAAREILHDPKLVTFLLSTARFENGSGASQDPFKLVLLETDGLAVSGADGQAPEKLNDFTAEGLQDLIVSPDSKKFLVRLAKDQVSSDKKTLYRGVYLGHIDRFAKGKPFEMEALYAKNTAHTIWFSPTGKYATWASADAVAFRAVDGKAGSEVNIPFTDRGELPIKGVAWDKGETRLAIACGNRIYLYDVDKKATTLLAKVGDDPKMFVADPVWRGEEILFTQFTDTAVPRSAPPPK